MNFLYILTKYGYCHSNSTYYVEEENLFCKRYDSITLYKTKKSGYLFGYYPDRKFSTVKWETRTISPRLEKCEKKLK